MKRLEKERCSTIRGIESEEELFRECMEEVIISEVNDENISNIKEKGDGEIFKFMLSKVKSFFKAMHEN